MAIEMKSDKEMEGVSFVKFLHGLKDEREEVLPFNSSFIADVCHKIMSVKTSRALSKLPGIEEDMVNAMNMIDTYFRSNKYQKELRTALSKLQSNCELDYFAFQLRNEG